jgi:F-type H+-transporting ATPase subunit a
MIAFAFALLLAQSEPARPPPAQQEPAAASQTAAEAHEPAAEAGARREGVSEGHEARPNGETAKEAREEKEEEGIASHIFHHVQDETVWPLGFWVSNRYVRLDITKHAVNMWLAAAILLFVVAFGAHKRALVPKGGYNLLESLVMFIRDEISVKNIGHHADLYTGYLCTTFFFILFMNFAGLLPIPSVGGFPGISTATGNLSVTVVLALFTFVLTQIAGMRAQGVVGYWVHLVPGGVPKALWPLMFVIEFFGLFTKPFALTVRLFANMVAGHIVIFFLIALTLFISVWVAPVSIAFALGIFLLELFVGLVQAYVFTILSALFIGMTQHAH